MLGYREAMVSWLPLWSASPHPTLLAPNWGTHSKYRTTDGSSTGLLPSITQFILAGPQRLPTGSSKEHRHHPDQQWLTSYMEGGLHPTRMEDYILHGGRTTFYTEGRPHPTQIEDCYREADSFEAVLFSHFMDTVCRGLDHINASMYGGVCSLLPLWIPGTKFRF